ncbi:hypothetical protein OG21DRAFT_1520503 [Imleria badia]|nr:hypothetical protein OG21DRAFT_1520503 [Imleria badia]
MRIGNYTARILVDDEELGEYHVELVTPTRVTCWIASEAGKTFGIEWRCHTKNRTKGNVGWVNIDGIMCGGLPMYPGHVGRGDTGGMYSIDMDEDHLLHKEVPEGFGEVFVEIEHGKLVKAPRIRNKDMRVLDGNDKFHEMSRKAAHHRVAFGPEKAREGRVSISNLVVNDEPSLFFVFKYRPIGF